MLLLSPYAVPLIFFSVFLFISLFFGFKTLCKNIPRHDRISCRLSDNISLQHKTRHTKGKILENDIQTLIFPKDKFYKLCENQITSALIQEYVLKFSQCAVDLVCFLTFIITSSNKMEDAQLPGMFPLLMHFVALGSTSQQQNIRGGLKLFQRNNNCLEAHSDYWCRVKAQPYTSLCKQAIQHIHHVSSVLSGVKNRFVNNITSTLQSSQHFQAWDYQGFP